MNLKFENYLYEDVTPIQNAFRRSFVNSSMCSSTPLLEMRIIIPMIDSSMCSSTRTQPRRHRDVDQPMHECFKLGFLFCSSMGEEDALIFTPTCTYPPKNGMHKYVAKGASSHQEETTINHILSLATFCLKCMELGSSIKPFSHNYISIFAALKYIYIYIGKSYSKFELI